MTKITNGEYPLGWWKCIKSYLENPTKEALVDLLEQVYEDGYYQGWADVKEDYNLDD